MEHLPFINPTHCFILYKPQNSHHRGLFDHRHHGHGVQALPRPGRCVARARYGEPLPGGWEKYGWSFSTQNAGRWWELIGFLGIFLEKYMEI